MMGNGVGCVAIFPLVVVAGVLVLDEEHILNLNTI